MRYVTRIPVIGNLDVFWNKKSFFNSIEKVFQIINAYGPYWKMGS